jgi:predicted acylesterase/phospholipase RssA
MCAIKTDEELLQHVFVNNVSTDYMSNGKMKAEHIRWFPRPLEMASYWFKNKLLVESGEFRRTCEFYYADITFEEAFERTGKHVCINVSASRATGNTAQRLLLNHISTPHVTIASAVAASCALPGVMAPTTLIVKNSNGFLEPFLVDGVEWIDGSVQADLPFQRISTLFAVSSFIVSQTNFHIVPFLNKAHHPGQKSLYWRLFSTIEWDIRSRALKLSRLGLFPHVFGQDISKVFKQRYHGNLTIVPRFTTMQTLGLHVLANPTVEDMNGYLKYGQIAAWPHLNAIRYMIRLERSLDDCISRLEERLRAQHPGDPEWSFHDDVDSIASSSALATGGAISSRVRIVGRPSMFGSRESSAYTANLLEENQSLKKELEHLKSQLGQSRVKTSTKGPGMGDSVSSTATHEEEESVESRTPNENTTPKAALSDGKEGHLWNMILSKIPKK